MNSNQNPEQSQPKSIPLRGLKLYEVCLKTTLSRTSLWRRIKSGSFPKPFLLGGAGSRAVAWLSTEVDQWLLQQAAKRDE